MNTEDEMRHLQRGPADGEAPEGTGLIQVKAATRGAAADLVARCREVLTAALALPAAEFESDHPDASRFPAWFVEACAPDDPEAEQAWIDWWRTLDPEGKQAAEASKPWTFSAWLSWLHPEERQWYWWDAQTSREHGALIRVQVQGWPAPLGSLEWLLRASGATEVTIDG